jgi:hypothetical protein
MLEDAWCREVGCLIYGRHLRMQTRQLLARTLTQRSGDSGVRQVREIQSKGRVQCMAAEWRVIHAVRPAECSAGVESKRVGKERTTLRVYPAVQSVVCEIASDLVEM